ncbi:MAG: CpXC domain-containing protein [Anaerolineae bacterium]
MSYILQPKDTGSPRAASAAGGPGGMQIQCPRCHTAYTAPVVNMIDARLNPQLKAALLAGLLNRTQCPSCGSVAVMSVPLIYHDPDKELLLVLVPSELNLSSERQQRLIGGLVQAIMSSVPADERKGYFLRPQTLLTMQGLIEKVLEADGVTAEMIEQQRRRFQLLDELLRALTDEAQLTALIRERREELDYAFFVTLMTAAREAELGGDTAAADRLLSLRERLVQVPEIAARLPEQLAPDTSVEAAISRLMLLMDDDEALAAMASINRPLWDYRFFQGLTQTMEQAQRAGDTARAERLAQLRQKLLEEIQQQDRAMQAAQAQDLEFIERLLAQPDPSDMLRQSLPRFDTLFLSTLSAAIQAARAEGDIARSARLDTLRERIINTLAEAMPPELKLVNRLLGSDSPEERQALLSESATILSEDLVALVDGMLEELGAQGRGEVVRRLEIIRAEIQQQAKALASERQSRLPQG